jgi:hypothetical protein
VTEVALAPGLLGTSAAYTYNFGGEQTDIYNWQVVLATVPETIGFAPSVTCHARGVKFLGMDDRVLGILDYASDEVGDTSVMPRREVGLESEALEGRFEIRVDHELGENWVRQLFSPSFISWLGDRAPEKLCFELVDGSLCVFVPAGGCTPEELNAAAVMIASRLREEALEEAGMDSAGRAAVAASPHRTMDAATADAVATVDWDSPPADVETAMKAYRWIAMRTWRPWVIGPAAFLLLLAIGALVTVAGWFSQDADSLEALLGGVTIMLSSPFVGVATWRKFVNDRARRFGKAAFAEQYARSRALTPEHPRLVQARNMQLRFPGVAEAAMTGVFGGADLEGTLVLSGEGSGSSRSDYDVVITQKPPAAALPDDGKLSETLSATAQGSVVAIWQTAPGGDRKRSAKGLDSFCKGVGEAVAGLGSAPPAAPAQSS